MSETTTVPSRIFPVLALFIAVGVTAYVWRTSRSVPPSAPLTALRVAVGVANHVLYGGGCPNGYFDPETIVCTCNPHTIEMTLTCKATGAVLSTDMVKGIPGDKNQFTTVAVCGESSVVAWAPAKFVFGVKNLEIELISRDPEKIIKMMCGGSSGPDAGQAAEGLTPRPAEIATRSPTPEPR